MQPLDSPSTTSDAAGHGDGCDNTAPPPTFLSDEAMLLFAAKANGIVHTRYPLATAHGIFTDQGKWWQPLVSNGDALHSAVNLEIKTKTSHDLQQAFAWDSVGNQYVIHYKDCDNDHCAALRRVIVLAAASFGKLYGTRHI